MTMQIPDTILIEGTAFHLQDNLAVPDSHPDIRSVPPGPRCSANWRGYHALWSICDARLHLQELDGKFGLSSEGPVFSDWVTSMLRCPLGRPDKTLSHPYAPVHEAYLELTVKEGIVTRWRIKKTGVPPKARTKGHRWSQNFSWPKAQEAIRAGQYRRSAWNHADERAWKFVSRVPPLPRTNQKEGEFVTWADIIKQTRFEILNET